MWICVLSICPWVNGIDQNTIKHCIYYINPLKCKGEIVQMYIISKKFPNSNGYIIFCMCNFAPNAKYTNFEI